jgi:hypothetical protein
MIEAHQGTDHLPCKKSRGYLAPSVQMAAEEESAMIFCYIPVQCRIVDLLNSGENPTEKFPFIR